MHKIAELPWNVISVAKIHLLLLFHIEFPYLTAIFIIIGHLDFGVTAAISSEVELC
jgi:hypothetical protein